MEYPAYFPQYSDPAWASKAAHHQGAFALPGNGAPPDEVKRGGRPDSGGRGGGRNGRGGGRGRGRGRGGGGTSLSRQDVESFPLEKGIVRFVNDSFGFILREMDELPKAGDDKKGNNGAIFFCVHGTLSIY